MLFEIFTRLFNNLNFNKNECEPYLFDRAVCSLDHVQITGAGKPKNREESETIGATRSGVKEDFFYCLSYYAAIRF
jgi:hypothetical protein